MFKKKLLSDCGQLSAPDFGSVLYPSQSTIYQSTAEFRCTTGRYLQGVRSTTCTATGSWNLQRAPQCLLYGKPIIVLHIIKAMGHCRQYNYFQIPVSLLRIVHVFEFRYVVI